MVHTSEIEKKWASYKDVHKGSEHILKQQPVFVFTARSKTAADAPWSKAWLPSSANFKNEKNISPSFLQRHTI